MKKHVTSLELSKRLKALGVKQESEFYWVESQINHKWVIERKEMVRLEIFGDSATSAFLASELGELLPSYIKEKISYWSVFESREKYVIYNLQIIKRDKLYCASYYCDELHARKSIFGEEYERIVGYLRHKKFEDSSLSNALALMLEYLIQHKLITI